MTYLIIGLLIGWFGAWTMIKVTPIDDTDVSWDKRSGMRLGIDYRTGIHYLMGGNGGGITPRLDANGKQIRNPTESPNQ